MDFKGGDGTRACECFFLVAICGGVGGLGVLMTIGL